MISSYLRHVLLPALGWALFAGSGFIGIGGMDLPPFIPDRALWQFWQIGGLVTAISFAVATAILTRTAVKAGLLLRNGV